MHKKKQKYLGALVIFRGNFSASNRSNEPEEIKVSKKESKSRGNKNIRI